MSAAVNARGIRAVNRGCCPRYAEERLVIDVIFEAANEVLLAVESQAVRVADAEAARIEDGADGVNQRDRVAANVVRIEKAGERRPAPDGLANGANRGSEKNVDFPYGSGCREVTCATLFRGPALSRRTTERSPVGDKDGCALGKRHRHGSDRRQHTCVAPSHLPHPNREFIMRPGEGRPPPGRVLSPQSCVIVASRSWRLKVSAQVHARRPGGSIP